PGRVAGRGGLVSGTGIFAYWPNRITAIRFVGSIVLFVLLPFTKRPAPGEVTPLFQLCFWIFVTTAFTDALDGYLARRDNRITAFGRVADPFVDKVLVLGAMIFLATLPWSREWFPAWIVVTVLAREFLVTGLRGYIESLGLEFPADWFGKIKMTLQCIAIGVVIGMFAFGWSESRFLYFTAWVFVYATLLTSVGSGITYVLRTKRLLAEAVH
ncbi:MAG: CDP-diacylglycerol--glycerol-3-phosphate 3-phosphatidyltransferase, partial [Planctomycetota bacterium]|nr:CDP-diacylglycerol--glycerol-3-phosphate 3-phosphatidyltransferase [Planctomycetota bacterium]